MNCDNCGKRIGLICRYRKKNYHAIHFEGGKMLGNRNFCSDKCALEMMDKLGLKQSSYSFNVWTNKIPSKTQKQNDNHEEQNKADS